MLVLPTQRHFTVEQVQFLFNDSHLPEGEEMLVFIAQHCFTVEQVQFLLDRILISQKVSKC